MTKHLRGHRADPCVRHFPENKPADRWIGSILATIVAIAFLASTSALAQSAAPDASATSDIIPAGEVVPSDAPGAASGGVPDLSGLWVLQANSRRQLDKAQLTPEGIKMAQDAQALIQAGHVITRASRWCHYKGVPFMMGQSPPVDIVQTKDEVTIFAEQISSPRYVYMDGRPHPDPKFLEPTTNGHSIGHWEGDTLVIDTVGFNNEGVVAIPGGGTRTHNGHLVEHYRLAAGGKQLIATFTWEDSTLAKPHSYEFTYYKMSRDSFVFEDDCDASDTSHWLEHSTTEPPQN